MTPEEQPNKSSATQSAAPAAAATASAKPETSPATAPTADKAPPPSEAPSALERQPVDEFDPLGWNVPLICKDCEKPFVAPYRNFHAGVVFHCPSCQGSWVPNTTIAATVRRVFESFWRERRRTRDSFNRGELKIDRAAFEQRQAEELKAFNERLERLAAELRPAGKLVRPKGLAAMFT